MKWKIHRVVPLLTLLALGHARSAAAQSAAPSSPTADQRFANGLDSLQHGDDAAALAAFSAIPSHERTGAVYCNIGLAESGLGHPAESVDALERCFESGAFMASLPEQDQLRWRGLLVRQQKLVARLSAVAKPSIPTQVSRAEVVAGGAVAGAAPLSAPVELAPGAPDIEVRLEGPVSLRAKERVDAAAEPLARFERQRRWGIGLFAGGAVLAGAGAGALGFFTQQAERPFRDHALCDSNWAANDTACPAYRLGQAVGGVGLGLGVAMLVAGAWLYLGNDRSSLGPASRERGAARLSIAPILGVTPGRPEASLGLLGSF